MSMEIARKFKLSAEPVSCERYGNGHINDTYLVCCADAHRYILQRMNRTAFPNIEGLMGNIQSVTEYLAKDDPDGRHTLHLVHTLDDRVWYTDESGEAWRIYEFVERSVCFERIEDPKDFYQSAIAFGGFQRQLSGFPAHTLYEVIPGFHDTIIRYAQLRHAYLTDPLKRAESAARELEFAWARENGAGVLVEGLRSGALPTRVTHNDTKLNNVLFDEAMRQPLCIIDLDTVMPGAIAFDFGDSIRFGATTAAEDEPDLDKVHFSIDLFRAYARGFLKACGKAMDEREVRSLADGARLMTLECGIRFLADYLLGDVYFHIAYPEHNLIRCRTQLKLVAEMEAQKQQMIDILLQEWKVAVN